ncbi:FtsK/SpoIIIE domain-containing protein [Streptomyces racemochromogenes]|uniref:FtsK/SpoIIIE domain-containing protein n=1 Tax=Streptomyces racemochromogenes TaxID=67353 RepID=UPI0035F08672
MGKKQQEQDVYAQAAGAIGSVVIVFGILAAIKEKTGLPWVAVVALTVGVLIALGYGAWKIRSLVSRAFTGGTGPVARLKQETAAQVPAESAVESVPAHPELTAALVTAGAIGKEQVIRAEDATVTDVKNGKLYNFLVPEGRTYEDVEKKLGTVAGMFGVTRLHMKLERSRDNERRVQLLKLHNPPFSSPFVAPTRQQIESFSGIPLGHDVTGELAGVSTFSKASLLVAGMTQMGKTTLVNGLITCLLIAYGEFELYLLDGKFCGLTRFESIATVYKSSDDPDVFEAMVDELNERSDKRYEEIKEAIRKRQPVPKFKPIIFITDEAADFFAHDESREGKEKARRIAEKTRSLVSKSLESEISSVLMTQRPAQNAIPVMVRDQFLYRMCLYVASSGTAKVALGDTYFETVAPINPALLDPDIKGQAVLFANGRSTLIRGFNFSDEFVWGVVDEIRNRHHKTLQKAPDSPLARAITLMRSSGVDFMTTRDLAEALGIEESDPVKRGKQLNQLLEVTAHKGAKGVRGYLLADLTAAALSRS